MSLADKVQEIIAPSLEAMGYAIVQINVADAKSNKIVTIMAERSNDEMMTFDDCEKISHTAGTLLEVDDPISTAYNLEVCSPGLERPLTKAADYTRFAHQGARIETYTPINGQRKFTGIIAGIDGDTVALDAHTKKGEGEAVGIELSNIRTAKLTIPDDYMDKIMKSKKGQN